MNKKEFEFSPSMTLTGQERLWVLEALEVFYHDHIITDILYRVKGGKEATVFCCRANPSTGFNILAAKIFRPRMFRAMKNDSSYRNGRILLDAEGKSIHESRQYRAIRKKTRFGKCLSEVSWHFHEYETLRLLHDAGADVPKPIAQSPNAILMEFIGNQNHPAPTLHDVALEPAEAKPLFHRLMKNIRLFLACNRIHADLSAYNVLYWQGQCKIIDLPQTIDITTNPNAFFFLSRDIDHLCRYFAKQGVPADANQLSQTLWRKYLQNEL